MVEFSGVARLSRKHLLGCSVVALTAALGAAAHADCLPDPPVANGSVSCTSATVGGLTVPVSATVVVGSGASLTAASGDAAAFTAISQGSGFYASTINLNVDGLIDGASASGVLVSSGLAAYYPATQLNITVGQNGVIQGATAVEVISEAAATYGRSIAAVDNSGTIQSTSGPALVAANSSLTGFSAVTNRAGGYIGGIYGVVTVLTNDGTIDGGAGSAYAYAATNTFGILPSTLNNTGDIQSNGTAATVNLPAGQAITNSGRIINSGSGAAINATQYLSVDNEVGGVIASSGAVAINADGLTLINRGTISGSVITSGAFGSLSSIDLVGGLIQGDLLLGATNDTLIAAWDSTTGRLSGVTGRIDGGGGVNTLQLALYQNGAIDSLLGELVLPTNFQKLRLQLTGGAAVSLNGDAADGLLIDGTGSFTTNGAVTSQGAAFKVGYPFGSSVVFTNTGTITASFPPPASDPNGTVALNLNVASFSNTGTITANGGDAVSAYVASTFSNTGTITASGQAVSVSSGTLTNTGLIRSTGGVAVAAGAITNAGVIEGATTAVSTNGVLVNTGTITATNGPAVNPGMYGVVDNRAGGVITGTVSVGWPSYGGGYVRVLNAGVLNGDVKLKSIQDYADYYATNLYADDGGTLNGSLTFGIGWDTVITDLSRYQDGRFTGVTGTVDAGGGTGVDTLLLRVTATATRTIAMPTSFETLSLDLQNGVDLNLTVTSPLTTTLGVTGQGDLDLTANIAASNTYAISLAGRSAASAETGGYNSATGPLSVVSRGALTITQSSAGYAADGVYLVQGSKFENAGVLTMNGNSALYYTPSATVGAGEVLNSGTILLSYANGVSNATKLTNTGVIKQADGGGVSTGGTGLTTVVNSGVIETGGQALSLYGYYNVSLSVANSGRISSTGSGAIASSWGPLTLTNSASGVISSTTGNAIQTQYSDDTITNDGVITGTVSLGDGGDVITNHGVITGNIVQGYGDARIENYGVINGNVSLGGGNDTFVQWVGGAMNGTVDGGYGLDTLVIDSTGGGTISTSQFINFESFKQIGGGSLNYVGAFGAGPIVLDGSSAVVLAGDSVTTTGAVTFSGGAGSEHVTVAGSISGGVSLGDGVDSVVNRGAIGGDVLLGAGDDSYTEGWGSTTTGVISGGAGSDTYIVELAGDRASLRSRDSFENLGVTGTGTLTLALDQNWDSISLAGANLNLTAGAYTVGRLTGGAANEAVQLDKEIAQVDLGGGDDSLQLSFAQVNGAYAGGAGTDVVHFTTTAPVTVAGALSGFETIVLDGAQMTVSGTLGATGDTASFSGAGGQTLSILSGGVLAGTVDLGAGDDRFELAAGGQLLGTVLGGAGDDTVAIDLTSDLSLRGDQLQQFETLQVTGTGALNFTGGAAKFDHLVTAGKDLTLAAGASLSAGDLTLDGAANTVTLAGAFTGALDLGAGDDVLRLTTGATVTGSVQGGAGQDRLELALGGTDAAPIALGNTAFQGFETLSVQSGVISVSGGYGFDAIEVQNGRLIGLAGSQLTASTITVAQGATFGSAGSVTGNITVAGTLSPGASPGTMTVTGDVALAASSTSLFEFTPTVSDKLLVSGKLTIAQGATLKLVGASTLTPGRRLDLIVADGGIVGSFSTIDGAQGLNLHITQSTNRLEALALFTTDTTFSSQVSGLIGQLNTALINNTASASLITAMSNLVDPTTGKSDPRALARVTPQAYASATQLALEDGLSVVAASRAQARFAPDAPGLFGFGQAIASSRTLKGDAAVGVVKGKIDTTGGLAGVGYGVKSAWAGVFVGYLNGRQRLGELDARTGTDSFVIGAQGQVRIGGLQLGAMAAHDGADANTRRTAHRAWRKHRGQRLQAQELGRRRQPGLPRQAERRLGGAATPGGQLYARHA